MYVSGVRVRSFKMCYMMIVVDADDQRVDLTRVLDKNSWPGLRARGSKKRNNANYTNPGIAQLVERTQSEHSQLSFTAPFDAPI